MSEIINQWINIKQVIEWIGIKVNKWVSGWMGEYIMNK